MISPDAAKRFAWEPVTPPGVAAFASASLRRLFGVQFLFALAAASVLVWFLKTAWYPTITTAVLQLPAQGEIHDGTLEWPGASPQLLAEGNFLAFVVDLDHEGQLRSPAHIQIEFGRRDVCLYSLFGCAQLAYPPGWIFPFNRAELEPKWGAWRPPVLWLAFGGALIFLMANWFVLATLYCLPVWLVGFFANRNLSLAASWKLAGAALMPGAALLTATIFFYGLGSLDPVQLVAGFAAHFVTGWIYLFAAPLFALRIESAAGASVKNPFAASSEKIPPAVEKSSAAESPDARSKS